MFKVIIWDEDGLPLPYDSTIILWRSFSEGNQSKIISIPRLIEENAENLKARYLAWIYDLGEMQIRGKSLKEHLVLRVGLSYWWMTLFAEKCNYSKSPQIVDAIRFMAFTDWAIGHSVKSVTLTSANKALADTFRLWCNKQEIQFKWCRSSVPLLKGNWIRCIYQLLPFTLQGLLWALRFIFEAWGFRGAGLEEWKRTEGRVTFVSYLFNFNLEDARDGRHKSAYWGTLPEVLDSEGLKTNWLHLYVKNKSFPASVGVEAIRHFNCGHKDKQVHVALETFLSGNVIFRAARDWIRLILSSFRLESSITKKYHEHNELNLWPLFIDDWRQSMFGPIAVSNILNYNLFKSAMTMLPKQDAGVFLQENQGWEFGFIQAWRAAGHGQLVGCPHSSVRFWDLRYFFDPRDYEKKAKKQLPMPDKVALNGDLATDAYVRGGYPSIDLVQTEALRYLYLEELFNKKGVTEHRKDSLRLLVLGDYLQSDTQMQMDLLEKAIQHLTVDVTIIIKPHPACPIAPEDYPNLCIKVVMDPIVKLLVKCDIAYCGAVTSAAVDAYCAGVPVISVLDPNALNLSPLRGCLDVHFVRTPSELTKAIYSTLSAPNSQAIDKRYFTIDKELPRWRKLLTNIS